MLWVWFGLDGTGIQRSVEFHWLLGPILMVAFAFLGNTLFLTILVSMLSTTFSTIVSNATAEIQFRRAVLTLEGVKSDAIFAYQPPTNILALLILLPLKFVVTPRWFHKINVAAVRALNAPLLLLIGFIERRTLWAGMRRQKEGAGLQKSHSRVGMWDFSRGFNAHGDLQAVFDAGPPQELEEDDEEDMIEEEDLDGGDAEGGREVVGKSTGGEGDVGGESPFEREFTSVLGAGAKNEMPKLKRTTTSKSTKSRRDSVAPWTVNMNLGSLRNMLSGRSEDGSDGEGDVAHLKGRLDALEQATGRIERMLGRLCEELDDSSDDGGKGSAQLGVISETGTLKDLDRSGTEDIDD